MAPAATYESPMVQLGRLAIAARERGMSFEDFWYEAVREGRPLIMTNKPSPPYGCIRWPTDRNDRHANMKAIYETKDGWRRAYEGIEPTPGEQAIGLLAESISKLARAVEADALPTQQGLASVA